ncbi:MAG: hypothetical protein J6K26_11630 [Lachnospiraceae bacterium]|nr:hypothetical protein [Lachnospiraceae bacterium]MBP3470152.1 hypothetical protein [Lachnospiraceae bacterium]
MENRFPLLAGRRILRKESLWDIRDYAYAGWQLYYADYTDGLLRGCDIRSEDGQLVIGKGMLKFHGFVYLMQEEERVPYQPENRWQVLKAEFSEDETNLDYKAYRVRFFLDNDVQLKENQIEMCRFYLREGSVLRDSYKDFSDMSTEYDTLNLIHATVAGVGEQTLHPALLRQFAEELSETDEKEAADFAFYYTIESNNGKVERLSIKRYLQDKGRTGNEGEAAAWGNADIYAEMERILRNKGAGHGKGYGRKLIYVE